MKYRLGDVLDIHTGLDHHGAVGLGNTLLHALSHLGCGGADVVKARRSLETWFMALLAGVADTRGASSMSLLQEHQVQFVERIKRNPWRTELHAPTDRGTEHPGGNNDDDPRLDFYMDDLAVGALLAVLLPDTAAVQRMPPVEDFNFLPDMAE